MGLKFTNNSEATLSVQLTAGATTNLTLQTGEGTQFPTVVAASGDYFYVTLVDVSGNREIIKVTEHQAATDVFQTIERAADTINGAATARTFNVNDKVQGRLNAAAILAPTGTDNADFHIDQDGTGPRIKNNSGVLEVRNATDAAYANLKALGLTLTAALVIAGSITGATTGAFSGALTVGGTSSIPIDNEATSDKIKARDHGTATDPEVVNVVYGTGSPPAASTTPIGSLFIKYIV